MEFKESTFLHRTPREEFEEFTNQELGRLVNSDADFDEALYKKAVEMVLQKLKKHPAP